MRRRTYLDLLILLLQSGGGDKVFATTGDIARELGISQQSASRWIIQLEREGFLRRGHSTISLTEKALEELRKLYCVLKGSFEEELPIRISGYVVSGLKDGQYYLSLPRYVRQFEKKLGFSPFPGTLNVVIDERDKKLMLSRMRGIMVNGFSIGRRVLGKVKCFPAVINDKVEGALVLPERSHYNSGTVEVISKYNLRKVLKLKDGSRVRIKVVKPETS
ncbi:MAG: DUF120 domain-containing protein [Candidatus Micrarchaeia archaeon]